ncbi:hypothetical protein V1264_022575 [Littorina saxatilis]|uniref:Uncharacterized protein n=2 Tax=Littorina saxatilis TaxID=31220 RepID=A0AAN9FXM8_9CAEN
MSSFRDQEKQRLVQYRRNLTGDKKENYKLQNRIRQQRFRERKTAAGGEFCTRAVLEKRRNQADDYRLKMRLYQRQRRANLSQEQKDLARSRRRELYLSKIADYRLQTPASAFLMQSAFNINAKATTTPHFQETAPTDYSQIFGPQAFFKAEPGTVNSQGGSVRGQEQSGFLNTLNCEQSDVGASRNSMEEGDTGVGSDVKIEIDVAEDTPQCCFRTEPLQYVPFMEVVVTDNTATMPTVQTLEGQAAVSTHMDTWLKQEIQTPETQTAVNSHSDTWLKQEIQTPETQTAVSIHSDVWLKQEMLAPKTHAAVDQHSQ